MLSGILEFPNYIFLSFGLQSLLLWPIPVGYLDIGGVSG